MPVVHAFLFLNSWPLFYSKNQKIQPWLRCSKDMSLLCAPECHLMQKVTHFRVRSSSSASLGNISQFSVTFQPNSDLISSLCSPSHPKEISLCIQLCPKRSFPYRDLSQETFPYKSMSCWIQDCLWAPPFPSVVIPSSVGTLADSFIHFLLQSPNPWLIY